MFSNQDIIVIAFKLINFIAVIGVGYFLFKKYILPDLLLSIARKINKRDSLFVQQTNLEKQQYNLDIVLQEDAAQCENFRTKIDEWKKVITQEHRKLTKEHEQMMTTLRKRTEKTAIQREQKRIQKIVAHTVVKRLHTSLSDYFEKPKNNDVYLNSIIDFMNERIS
ncbi:MAG TPA: hypothetical protein VHX42_03360 [Candidatus Babeliales bacterium]|jgi:hypothetical protein|nr:hypothetical protein [Candidatus Babeliales bacterium]